MVLFPDGVFLSRRSIYQNFHAARRKGQLFGKNFYVHKKRRILNLIFRLKPETTPTNHGCWFSLKWVKNHRISNISVLSTPQHIVSPVFIEMLLYLLYWSAFKCQNIRWYQKDRSITFCRDEGLLGPHLDLIGLSVQILYPPHSFGDRNMPGMIDGDADRTEWRIGVITAIPAHGVKNAFFSIYAKKSGITTICCRK